MWPANAVKRIANPSSRKGPLRVLIFAAILAIFVYGMIAAMLGTILPDLSERFKLTPAQNGTIAFAQALGLMIASLAVGPLLDNRRRQDRHPARPGVHRHRAHRAAALARILEHRGAAVSAGSGRRHRGHRRQRAHQRRERDPSRHGAEPGEPVLRPGRAGHAVHCRQPLPSQLGAALQHHRGA